MRLDFRHLLFTASFPSHLQETNAEAPNPISKPSKPLPEWVVVGESILVRPYNWSGLISFVGPTQFASGTWIGVTLDAPTGKKVLTFKLELHMST